MSLSTPLKGRLEDAANIAILVAVVIFAGFFRQREYERFHPSAQPASAPLVGHITLNRVTHE